MSTRNADRGQPREVRVLNAHYDELEHRWNVEQGGNYEKLVTPNGNASEPIHRWFHLKEAFSHRLLSRVLKDLRLGPNLRILDPYVGGGTTAASAADALIRGELNNVAIYGVETNPFLHLLASTKLQALQAPPEAFEQFGGAIAGAASRPNAPAVAVPALSTFHKAEYFNPAALCELLKLCAALESRAHLGGTLAYNLGRICIAASIEPASRLRRDGRTLRHAPEKMPVRPLSMFLDSVHSVAEDLPIEALPLSGLVSLSDGRSLKDLPGEAVGIDLAIFSPPYPNNIDYTEVYKLEAWLLGLYPEHSDFRSQRLRTVRSHPSVRYEDVYQYESSPHAEDVSELLAPLIGAIPKGDRYTNGRTQVVRGYFDDMLRTLFAVYDRLRPGGHLVYVVGNSLHGSPRHRLLIAADLVIARLAEIAGLQVECLQIARLPQRRSNVTRYLRESIVFCRRPPATKEGE